MEHNFILIPDGWDIPLYAFEFVILCLIGWLMPD